MSPVHLNDSTLVAHLLGGLAEGERLHVEGHLLGCARCTGLLAQTNDDLAQLAIALPPPPVPAMLREGLQQALGEVSRFSDFMTPVAHQLNLERATVEGLLDNVDTLSAWQESLDAGMQTYQVSPQTWFLRVQPGHGIHSPDPHITGSALVLQGTCRNSAGQLFAAGATLPLGSDFRDRQFVALGGVDFICLFRSAEQAADDLTPPDAEPAPAP